MDVTRTTRHRQMWDLDPETEKVLANRSIWIRGLGLGSKTEHVLPLLERTGDRVQRVRIYKTGSKDRWGEFVIYATYRTEEAADLNMVRLRSLSYGMPKLKTKKAGPEGTYMPLTEELKKRLAAKSMTKADRMHIRKKLEKNLKISKIRERNKELRGAVGSSPNHIGSQAVPEAPRPKEDLKRKSSDETSSSNRESVDKKRIRPEESSKELIRKEVKEKTGERERRGPRTPPESPIIDRKRKYSDETSRSNKEVMDKRRNKPEESAKESIPKQVKDKSGERERRGPRTPPYSPLIGPKPQASNEGLAYHREIMEYKRTRLEESSKGAISKEVREKTGERERRGPRTPPLSPIIDRKSGDDRPLFLDRDDRPGPSRRRKTHHRGGAKNRRPNDSFRR